LVLKAVACSSAVRQRERYGFACSGAGAVDVAVGSELSSLGAMLFSLVIVVMFFTFVGKANPANLAPFRRTDAANVINRPD
jgi:hypothetical protein